MEKEIVIIAGANGVGKTTFARVFLREYAYEFLNADEFAKSLSAEIRRRRKSAPENCFFGS